MIWLVVWVLVAAFVGYVIASAWDRQAGLIAFLLLTIVALLFFADAHDHLLK